MCSAMLALLLAPQVFAPAQPVPLADAPRGLDVADLDGDGDPDVVLALPDADALQVLFNDGAGAFGLARSIAVGDGPTAVAAGDLDGDGVVDLVGANAGSLDASVLLGAGGGAFGPATAVPLGADARCAELADLDGDGALDLLVGTFDATSVLVLAGRGDGTFEPPVVYPALDWVFDLTVGDTDGDGDLDVLAATNLGGTRHLRNDGTGAFTDEHVFGTFGGMTEGVDLYDGDQDGDLDLLYAEGDGLALDPVVQPNDGTGSWDNGAFIWLYLKQAFMRIVAAVDLDGDGDPDFVSVGFGFQSMPQDGLYVRFGGAGIGAQPGFEVLAVPGKLADLEAVDVDGDGRTDLVGANEANATLDLFFNEHCPGPPIVASASPAVAPALSTEPVVTVLEGCGLGGVDQATVGGQPAPFEVLTDERVAVTLPPAPQLGPVPVEVSGPLGAASIDVTFVAAAPPLLVLPDGAALSVADGLALQLGAQPADLAFVAVSVFQSPTSLPGLVELEIGRQGQSLSLLATLAIPAQAWRELNAPIPPALLGETFHFEAAVLTPSAPSFPLATTNVVTGTVVP